MPEFYEFFAGGGMARAGLGENWRCTFANDFDPMKAAVYNANWGIDDMVCADIATVPVSVMRGRPDLAWASFPCQDVSLAGDGAGVGSADDALTTRSGAFWAFWQAVRDLTASGRQPAIVVVENVCGLLTSMDGADFRAIATALSGGGYRFGAFVADAALWLPQSRPRLFIVGVADGVHIPGDIVLGGPSALWHTPAVVAAVECMPAPVSQRWLWWNLPRPAGPVPKLEDIIEDNPRGVKWHTHKETGHLLAMMSRVNREKVERAQASGTQVVGTVYKRTRKEHGISIQRAEVRFDGIAGCLRTPGGGSSRQTILLVEGESIRSRLLSPREAARLMGLPDTYTLPARYNDAYQLAGDGVAVPVVRHLAEHLLEPILATHRLMVTETTAVAA